MRLELRLSIGCQHELLEECDIKEPWIRLTSSCPIPHLLGVGWNGDLLPHPNAHLKVFGDLVQVMPELIGSGRTVEGGIIADGPEEWLALILILGILPEALTRKTALDVLPLVNLALPAFVGPG
jgi:hypothetical protein